MNKILILLFLSYIPFISFSQETGIYKNVPDGMQNEWTAKENIRRLKKGALLVRLFTKETTREALKKGGKPGLADRVRLEQEELNKNIIAAFKKKFNFCPVYFFYSGYSDYIRNKEFDKVVFLNGSLQPDTTIKFNGDNFLTAELGYIEPDTANYHDNEYPHMDTEQPETKTWRDVSPYVNVEALIIKSDQFIQLKRPFPYYSRTYDDMPGIEKLEWAIKKMNRKLINFYSGN